MNPLVSLEEISPGSRYVYQKLLSISKLDGGIDQTEKELGKKWGIEYSVLCRYFSELRGHGFIQRTQDGWRIPVERRRNWALRLELTLLMGRVRRFSI